MPPALMCSTCGKSVPDDAPGEVCPACLLRLGFDDNKTLLPQTPTAELETLGFAAQPSIRENLAPTLDGICIPGYQILSELGQGGMGVVYKALHFDLKRFVALKMPFRTTGGGDHANPEQIERFRREAEAVARLQHPNIVQIYEVGEQGGRPYFSLEFVEGGSLADKLNGTPLPPAEAAQVVETLARAVHAAHERGIVHRDLKPGNVLLTTDGVPKITDFGLAKETDNSSSRTQEGMVVGTPSYMAPEQAGGETRSVGPAADTYALGAILYETLTGRPPFKGVTSLDTIMQVVSVEPAAPRGLQPQVPHDLETICLKCLHKDPARRYASALELAEDLHRFLGHEPIQARPASALERLLKWSRRHPAAAGLNVALAALLVTAFALVTWRWQEADRDKEHAESLAKLDRQDKEKADKLVEQANLRARAEQLVASEARRREEAERKRLDEKALDLERAQQFSFTSETWRAAGLIDGDPVKALEILENKQLCPPEQRDFPWRYQYQLAQRLVRRLALQEGGIRDGALSPDGKVLATRTADDKIRLWDFITGEPGLLLPSNHGGGDNVNDPAVSDGVHIVFSPDSETLATGGVDGLVKIWDVKTGELKRTLRWENPDGLPRIVESLAFHPDSKTLAVGGHILDQKIKDQNHRLRLFVVWIWDLASGTGKLLTSHARIKMGGGENVTGANYLLYSPDGETLAMGTTTTGAVLMLDPSTGAVRQRLRMEAGWVSGMGFSGDGKKFAFGNSAGNAFLYDLAAPKVGCRLQGHIEIVTKGGIFGVSDCKFTANGALVTAAYDGTVRIWDAATGQPRTVFRCGEQNRVLRMFLLPPGEHGWQELVAITPSEVQVWSMRVSAAASTMTFTRFIGGRAACAVAFDESSTRFAVAGADDLGVMLFQMKRQVYVAPRDKNLFRNLFPTETGPSWFTSIAAREDGTLKRYRGRTTAVVYGPAGSNMIVAGDDQGRILVWHVSSPGDEPAGQELARIFSGHTGPVTQLAISADAKSIVSTSLDGTLRLWDLSMKGGGTSTQPFAHDGSRVVMLALSKDGKRLVTGDQAGNLRVWDFEKRALLLPLPMVVPGPIEQICLTPDGKVAATVGRGIVAVHDMTTGTRLTLLVSLGVERIALTPDGKTLAIPGVNDRMVRLYDIASGHLRCELPVLSHNVFGLSFNHDGTVLATVSLGQPKWAQTGEVMLWAAAAQDQIK